MEKLGNFVFVAKGVPLNRRNPRWRDRLSELAKQYRTLHRTDKRSFLETHVYERVLEEGSQFEYWEVGDEEPSILENKKVILDKLLRAVANQCRTKKAPKSQVQVAQARSVLRTVTVTVVETLEEAPNSTENSASIESETTPTGVRPRSMK